ncbi:MAG: CoA transferase [Chloroflexota bacterium]|nr:CoA transferase [Chloroflexota bacterium]
MDVTGGGPLAGVRILAVEQYGAGPFGSMLLADLGAEVIKIEDPAGGDIARHVPPYTGEHDDSVYFQALNRRKKSVAIDTRDPRGRELFLKLVRTADVVYNNLRGDQPAGRGIDYAGLSAVKPEIVCVHVTGFGRHGPHTREPGYDYLMQGYAGWMSITGDPNGPPTKSGLSVVDLAAGIAAGLGMVSALRRADRTGIGCDVDASLYDTAISLLTYVGTWHLTRGYLPKREPDSSHPSQIPSQVLPTKDGWLVVMCAKEKFYRELVSAMDRPDLATDPRFDSFEQRLANRDVLIPLLKEVSALRTTDEWLSRLQGKVPCGPVRSVPEALADPWLRENGNILDFEHPEFGTITTLSSPIRVSGDGPELRRAPFLGEHTVQVLRDDAGLDDAGIEELRAAGVIGGSCT